MRITKREVIASVAIIAIMLTIGFAINEAIQQHLLEKYQVYDTAIRIETEDMFRYAMKTDSGAAFLYGEIKTLDPVTFPELGGQYSYIEREEQEYRRHARTVTKTYKDSDGKTHTKTETEYYWTWDTVDTETKVATRISFLNVEFDYSQISFSYRKEIDTIKTGHNKRNIYYGKDAEVEGTLFAILANNSISDTAFYENMSIDETVNHLESGYELLIFWIVWVLLIVAAVCGFYYLENRWLH